MEPPGAYTFSVTLSSLDTGCDQYADWWEVITPDGELVYRRILAHSHVNEQPFTRSGGPVELQETTQAIVRAHMNNAGYGGVAFSGSPASGFAADPSVTSALTPQLADQAPQPDKLRVLKEPPGSNMVTQSDNTLRLRDGRQLAYAEYGNPGGSPVMLFHGNPSSRLSWGLIPGSPFRPHLRLIAPDRPGLRSLGLPAGPSTAQLA